jgi:hypothetical protein
MKMIAALLAAVPLAALAAPDAAPAGFHERLYERYCEKLRESPEAYVSFVKRMMPLHGYTFAEFVPAKPGDNVRADCRAGAQRLAEVRRLVAEQGPAEAAR